ncbi:MAG TPA: DinB family protein [Bryobacteraceae bacterium]|nr:DinB family protein [Bryobacteraceae bacterium]
MGAPELAEYRSQFQNIANQAKALTSGLTEVQFNWRPGSEQWSIEECLGHLTMVGQSEIRLLESAIRNAKVKGISSTGPFQYSFLARAILRNTEPPVRRKFTSPRRFRAVHGQPLTAILPTFLHLQSQFIGMVEQSEGLDLARVKVPTPMSRLVRLGLGATLAQQAAHERRHLEQARRVREHPQFPQR